MVVPSLPLNFWGASDHSNVPSLLITAALLILWRYAKSRTTGSSLPPAPSGHWIWGNKDFINLPHRYVLLATTYKDALGDIIRLQTATETNIVINTIDLANRVLEKHAAITADRPRNVMVQEILGWSNSISLYQTHDERHKKMRRVATSALHQTVARSYAAQHLEYTLHFLRKVYDNPEKIAAITKDIAGAFIMHLTYGHKVVENDPLLKIAYESSVLLGKALSSHYLVNDFPILKYLPHWFPGAKFQRMGKEGRELRERYIKEPFRVVYDQVCRGEIEQRSYTSQLLEEKGGEDICEEDMNLIQCTAGTMFTAGSGTISGTVSSMLLMMALHPDQAQAARDEIDEVVGRSRVPELKDRNYLPYTEAFLQEVMRVCPIVPLGVAHIATDTIELDGHRIPKGASINANVWGMLRDPMHYPNPNLFDPTRFLGETPDPDPRKYIFGFGRRSCPGLHVANNSVWTMMAGLLAVFNIGAGGELKEVVSQLGGPNSERIYELFVPFATYVPKPFKCVITPRDATSSSLLENVIV